MAGIITSLINTAFFMFPGLLLVLVTFKGRYRINHIPIVVLLFFLLEAFLQYQLSSVFELPLPARFAGGIINVVSTVVIAKADVSRICFMFLAAMAYTTFIQNLIDILLLMISIDRSLLNLLLLVVTLPAAVLFSVKVLRKIIDIEGSSAWAVIWILPGIIGIEGLAMYNFGWLLRLNPIVLLLLLFIFVGTLVLSLSIIPHFLNQTAEQSKLALEVERASAQLEIEREQYLRITENIEFARRARHDLRHHFAVIEAFSGDADKINVYVKELESEIDNHSDTYYCGNHAVNAVIAHYLSGAKNTDIKTNIVIPEDTGKIKTSDLCVLVGNIVENAVTAASAVSENAYISIVSEVKSGFLSFSAENSYAGQTEIKRGVGLSSVQFICERYGGFSEITAGDNVFRVSAILTM